MITIEIENVEEVVQQQKGWFVANVIGAVIDLKPKVEQVVIDKLQASFAEQGIRATVVRT